MLKKKTRGPNFSANEKEILIHLVTKYKDVIENTCKAHVRHLFLKYNVRDKTKDNKNKKTDAVTTAIKNEGWTKLAEEFNSLSSFSARNTEQLKTLWDNIKRNTRKDKAATKKQTLLTGGGRPELPPPRPFQGQVEMLLGPTLDGLDNVYDSDAQFSEQEIILNLPNTNIKPSIECTEGEIEVMEVVSSLENDAAGPSGSCNSKAEKPLVLEDNEKNMWKGWSPAALKTKVSDTLSIKRKDSPTSSWIHRRRPKSSLHDKLLQSKLELVDIMKKNAETEAELKEKILEEELKQKKIETEMLLLKLKKMENEFS